MFSLCVTVCVWLSTTHGRGLFITKENPVEMLALLNLNVSIINSQRRKILKASVPLVCEGKHLYWIIALRLIIMPAITITNTYTHTRTEQRKRTKEKVTCFIYTTLGRSACVWFCCSGGKLSSLVHAATMWMTHYKEASIRYYRANHYCKTSDCIRNSLVNDNHIISLCTQP